MAILSASILSADFSALAADCTAMLDAGADWLHFDVMDGHFVPNISFGAPVLKCLHKALPQAYYDVHLMISDPAKYLPDFVAAGANSVTFHLEAMQTGDEVNALIDAIHSAGCRAGLSIRPGTATEALYPYLAKLDMVLLMSVEPGFGGQRFMPEAPQRVAAVKAECRRIGVTPHIELDGGINTDTAPLCIGAGADVMVMGSALFGAANPAAVAACIKEN